jgi:oligoribonuclease
MKKEYLLWLDLETSGLEPKKNSILEVAWILTTTGLMEVKCGQAVIKKERELNLNEFSKKTHAETGLLSEVKASKLSLEVYESTIIEAVSDIQGTIYLAGNCPQFDRSFINRYMKNLDERLSHRMFDVRTLQMADSFWGGDMLKTDSVGPEHRAMSDIRHSLFVARKSKCESIRQNREGKSTL